MSIFVLVVVIGGVFAGAMLGFTLGRWRNPPSGADQDRRLVEQTQRIEVLEEELRRLREQADFTERLLSERGEGRPGAERGET